MEWLLSILYGLVSGLAEFLPVSAEGHRAMLLRIFGQGSVPELMRLVTHLGCLFGVFLCCRGEFARLRRSRKLSQSRSRRQRQSADLASLSTGRLLRTALVPMALGLLLYARGRRLSGSLDWVAVFLMLNGLLLFVPRLLRSGNKDSRSVSPLDGVLLGLGAGLSVFPGISRVGAVISLAALRGAGCAFALQFSLLLSVPALAAAVVLDAAALAAAGVTGITVILAVRCLLCGTMALLGSWCAISMMRFLSVKAGFYGFAYYCWGAALFAFYLFMTI